MFVGDGEIVHRVGGGTIANLRLSSLDQALSPPGLPLLFGGTPEEAAAAMRRAFSKSRKWQALAGTVGTATVDAIRAAGFDVSADPTDRFANHARLIHPDGTAGLTDADLIRLGATHTDTVGC